MVDMPKAMQHIIDMMNVIQRDDIPEPVRPPKNKKDILNSPLPERIRPLYGVKVCLERGEGVAEATEEDKRPFLIEVAEALLRYEIIDYFDLIEWSHKERLAILIRKDWQVEVFKENRRAEPFPGMTIFPNDRRVIWN